MKGGCDNGLREKSLFDAQPQKGRSKLTICGIAKRCPDTKLELFRSP